MRLFLRLRTALHSTLPVRNQANRVRGAPLRAPLLSRDLRTEPSKHNRPVDGQASLSCKLTLQSADELLISNRRCSAAGAPSAACFRQPIPPSLDYGATSAVALQS